MPETIHISELTPDDHNANKGTQRGTGMLEDSLRRFGAGRSILADKNLRVIAGNKTLDGAAAIGLEDAIIVQSDGTRLVVVQRTDLDLNDNKTREMALHDNRVGQVNLEWDAGVLAELAQDGVKLDDLWGQDELTALLADIAGEPAVLLTDPDAIPDEVETRCKPGDLWKLGEHRLLCGDSTKAGDVARLMGGQKADCVFTDPPYGMRLDTDYTHLPKTTIKSKTYQSVIGDSEDFDPRPLLSAFDYVREQFWWGGDYYYHLLPAGGAWIVWDKRSEASDGLAGNHFEVCWTRQHHRRAMKRHIWAGFTARETDSARVHPTQKPVELCVDIIGQYTKSPATILDPFLGSGTTLIACEQLGRKCYGLEIDPHYCDVILQRWGSVTGKTAELLEGH